MPKSPGPFLVDPYDLYWLGIDPDTHFKKLGRLGAYALDRTKDAELIERLRSVHETHPTVQ
jgi:hypothetical protein